MQRGNKKKIVKLTKVAEWFLHSLEWNWTCFVPCTGYMLYCMNAFGRTEEHYILDFR